MSRNYIKDLAYLIENLDEYELAKCSARSLAFEDVLDELSGIHNRKTIGHYMVDADMDKRKRKQRKASLSSDDRRIIRNRERGIERAKRVRAALVAKEPPKPPLESEFLSKDANKLDLGGREKTSLVKRILKKLKPPHVNTDLPLSPSRLPYDGPIRYY